MAETAVLVEKGDLVGDKYRVEEVISRGASVVVAARVVESDEAVTLTLLPRLVPSPDARARFERAARAATKVDSEHVARVKDVGALADGTPWIATERVAGEDLATLLARRGKLPASEAAQIVLEACEGLRAAHAAGVVHGGLEPSVLVLADKAGGDPVVKVVDFAVPRVEAHDRRRRDARELVYSPWYMAPEQLRSAAASDARSDVWALGVVLYELVTGEVPYDGEALTEIVVKVIHDPLPLGKLPRALEPIIRRCVAKAPQARFDSVDELATALRGANLTPAPPVPATPPKKESDPPSSGVILGADDVELVESGRPPPVTDDDEAMPVESKEILSSSPPPRPPSRAPSRPPPPPRSPSRAPSRPPPPPLPPLPPRPKDDESPAASEWNVPTEKRQKPKSDPPRPRRPERSERRVWQIIAVALVPIGLYAAMKWKGKASAEPATHAAVVEVTPSADPSAAPPPSAPPTMASAEPPAASAREPEIVAVASATPSASAPPPVAREARVRRPASQTSAAAAAASPPPAPAPLADEPSVGIEVARRHHAAIRQACWESSDRSTSVAAVSVAVDASGHVTSASASATEASLARCVESQVRTWAFPPSTKASRSFQIPIRFRR